MNSWDFEVAYAWYFKEELSETFFDYRHQVHKDFRHYLTTAELPVYVLEHMKHIYCGGSDEKA